MCYICEARGNVGKNYKAAQKEIAEAKKALGPFKPPSGYLGTFKRSWGSGKNWTNPPSHRLWSNADLKAYGRDHTTPMAQLRHLRERKTLCSR